MQTRHITNVGERILCVKIFNSTAEPSSTSRRTQPFTTWTYARKNSNSHTQLSGIREIITLYIIVYDVRNKSIIYIIASRCACTHYSWYAGKLQQPRAFRNLVV